MAVYTQANRLLAIDTPLGKDVLLLTRFQGTETISKPFRFRLDLLAEAPAKVAFDSIVGGAVTVAVALPDGGKRYFNGVIRRFTQLHRDDTFVHYRAEMVPRLWFLRRKVQSRIFQHLSVRDVLEQVLAGLEVKFSLSGTYHPRDYCVQYRESDLAFATRLMEEEGIYYFFTHTGSSHAMVITDVPGTRPDVPGPSDVVYEEIAGGTRDEPRVTSWAKTQEVRSGKYTLRDHCFELPGKDLEAQLVIRDSVAVGKVNHRLTVADNEHLEIYDYPGGYAQRFDGIDKTGVERPEELQKIFEDKQRTVRVRMEQEQCLSLGIEGTSFCAHFAPGHKFTLARHFDADGAYLLTRVEHTARLTVRPGEDQGDDETASPLRYENRFGCVPIGLPYRPARLVPRPVISGVQTATVVGPPGGELFCDKYGRVKVQFHWDREGKNDGDSSCWVRVAQPWAGRRWGAFFWPRVGHEVVVAFEEGDPDQPLIVGSVYNAENMPPFALPARNQLAGFKSASVRGKAHENFNGIIFNDQQGQEHMSLHSERNMSFNSERDKMIHAGRHKGERVAVANMLTVGSLPGGGGSGGGFDTGNTMPEPPPIGVMGLNSIMVYGENLQVATGLNHQLAVGNNLQICINPAGLIAGVPGLPAAPALTTALGGGLGGNMQLTMGTSGSFVMGQAFDINLGPPKIEIKGDYKGKDHVPTSILCGVLGVAALLWVALYHELTEDHARAKLAVVFQALTDALLTAILSVEMALKVGDNAIDDTLKPLFRVRPEDKALDDSDWGILSFGAGALILASVLAPLEAIGSE